MATHVTYITTVDQYVTCLHGGLLGSCVVLDQDALGVPTPRLHELCDEIARIGPPDVVCSPSVVGSTLGAASTEVCVSILCAAGRRYGYFTSDIVSCSMAVILRIAKEGLCTLPVREADGTVVYDGHFYVCLDAARRWRLFCDSVSFSLAVMGISMPGIPSRSDSVTLCAFLGVMVPK